MEKKDAKIGMKVHPLGRGGTVWYILELGEKVAGVSSNPDADPKTSMGILYEKLVKFKDQPFLKE